MDLKKNLAKIKEKIKENVPLIVGSTSVLAVLAVVAVSTKKFLDENSSWDEGFKLTEVSGTEREDLMKDDNFCLLHIEGDEYMFVRRTTED